MRLSEALRERQGDQGLRAMARDLDVAVGTVEAWVKGWRRPNLSHIPKLAVYLDLTTGEVVAAALEDGESKGVWLSSLEPSAA